MALLDWECTKVHFLGGEILEFEGFCIGDLLYAFYILTHASLLFISFLFGVFWHLVSKFYLLIVQKLTLSTFTLKNDKITELEEK